MKNHTCTFRVSAKFWSEFETRNIESAVWPALHGIMKGYRVGCLKNPTARIRHIVEHCHHEPGSPLKIYETASLARTDDGRLAHYELIVDMSGTTDVVVDAEDEKDAEARGRDFLLNQADLGDLRYKPEFSIELVSTKETDAT